MMNIEAIVKKHTLNGFATDGMMRAALTEMAAVYEERIDALMVSHTEQMQELQRDKEYCCCGECTTLTPSTVAEREALQERIRQLETEQDAGYERDKAILMAEIDLLKIQTRRLERDERIRQLEGERVPEKMFVGDAPLRHPLIHDGYVAGWNACRDAMLAAQQQPKKEAERVPDGYVQAEHVREYLKRAKVPTKQNLFFLKPAEIDDMLAAAPQPKKEWE